MRDIYPNLKEARGASVVENHRESRWTICLVLSVSLVSSIFLGFCAYNYFWPGNSLLSERCPGRLLTMKLGPQSAENELWSYATFWSYSPTDEGQTDDAGDTADKIAKFAPRNVLARLEKMFKPLSLRSFEHLPANCQKKIPSMMVKKERRNSLNDLMRKTVMEFPENLGPLAPLVFSADLSSEFRFRDHVSDHARSVLNRADQMMKRRNQRYEATIPVYLSSNTPEIEQFFSPNGETDVSAAQRKTIEAAMADYRQTTKPLFIVMGDHSTMPGIAGNDVIKVNELPDSVALAIISSGNGTIFNHGLWPTFGALLARSNVTSHAMNKTIFDAANNASLNWKTSVLY